MSVLQKGFLALALGLLLACGGGERNGSFTLEPAAPVVGSGEQLVIAAQPMQDLGGDLEWEVQEPYGGGLLQSQGSTVTYVAPETAGTYHLILRAPRRDGRLLKQTVAVQVVGTSTLDPGACRLSPGGQTRFTAHMKGLPRTVRWSVQEPGGGEITEGGEYTAPARPGTYHVSAASTVDPSVTAQATVVVE